MSSNQIRSRPDDGDDDSRDEGEGEGGGDGGDDEGGGRGDRDIDGDDRRPAAVFGLKRP